MSEKHKSRRTKNKKNLQDKTGTRTSIIQPNNSEINNHIDHELNESPVTHIYMNNVSNRNNSTFSLNLDSSNSSKQLSPFETKHPSPLTLNNTNNFNNTPLTDINLDNNPLNDTTKLQEAAKKFISTPNRSKKGGILNFVANLGTTLGNSLGLTPNRSSKTSKTSSKSFSHKLSTKQLSLFPSSSSLTTQPQPSPFQQPSSSLQTDFIYNHLLTNDPSYREEFKQQHFTIIRKLCQKFIPQQHNMIHQNDIQHIEDIIWKSYKNSRKMLSEATLIKLLYHTNNQKLNYPNPNSKSNHITQKSNASSNIQLNTEVKVKNISQNVQTQQQNVTLSIPEKNSPISNIDNIISPIPEPSNPVKQRPTLKDPSQTPITPTNNIKNIKNNKQNNHTNTNTNNNENINNNNNINRIENNNNNKHSPSRSIEENNNNNNVQSVDPTPIKPIYHFINDDKNILEKKMIIMKLAFIIINYVNLFNVYQKIKILF